MRILLGMLGGCFGILIFIIGTLLLCVFIPWPIAIVIVGGIVAWILISMLKKKPEPESEDELSEL